jgi:hypothetical protein
MKFQIVDIEENNYIVVEYKSGIIPDLCISMKVLFSFDTVEVPLDYGYGDYETHTSKQIGVYIANEFDLICIADNDDNELVLEESQNILVHQESVEYFKNHFEGYNYNELSRNINLNSKIN